MTEPCVTEHLAATPAGIARAAELLRAGRLVAFPTETVYGLGANARDGRAVARVYQAKGRPAFNPLIVHVDSLEAAAALGRLDATAQRLAEAFWPGPMSLVVPLRAAAGLSDLVTAGLPTVALRVPAHDLARALVAAVGPVAAPSANPSGRISPTTAAHVLEGLGGRIAAVVDGGPCPVGLESTIVGLADGVARLLRPGGLPAEAVEACLGRPLAGAGTEVEAPGMLASHYAPGARLRIAPEGPEPGEVWIGYGPADRGGALNLSVSGDLTEAAAALFATLRAADAQAGPGGRIAVRPVPEQGLGRAINDRLRRAAAPRE
jgi:L-threonylcarbamoyladenylate synthase